MLTCTCCIPGRRFKNRKALNGHLGQQRSKASRNFNYEQRIKAYKGNPTTCKQCGDTLSYKDAQSKKVFCGSSCSATYNNVRRTLCKTYETVVVKSGTFRKTRKQKRLGMCLQCGNGCVKRFCSIKCSSRFRWTTETLPRILSGNVSHRPPLRKYLIELNGRVCSMCSSDTWLNLPISLEVDHIDGNGHNNQVNNLRLLCPNCHSTTATYKGRNRGFGRKSRSQRLTTNT